MVAVEAAARINPEEYTRYFEELNPAPNEVHRPQLHRRLKIEPFSRWLLMSQTEKDRPTSAFEDRIIDSTVRRLAVLLPALFAATCGVSIIVPLLPLYAEQLGASALWLGVIFSAFSLARFIGMPVAGYVSGRLGRKRPIAVGLLLYSLISLGFVTAGSSLTLTFLRLGQGLCAAMIVPIAQAYIGDISHEKSEGRMMGVFLGHVRRYGAPDL